MSQGKSVAVVLVLYFMIVGIILLVLHFLGILLLAAVLLGMAFLVVMVTAILLVGIVLILATPYYLLAKRPVVEKFLSYRIESIKGKEDWKKKG